MNTLKAISLFSIPVGGILPAGKPPQGDDYLPANGATLFSASANFSELLRCLLARPEIVVSVETWESLADRFGGVPYFALDRDSDTIRLPYLSEMHMDMERNHDRIVFPSPGEKLTNYVKVK